VPVVVNLDQLGDGRLVDLDVDISDAVLFNNLPTLAGHNNAITERDAGITSIQKMTGAEDSPS
jgi:hypothetical protein